MMGQSRFYWRAVKVNKAVTERLTLASPQTAAQWQAYYQLRWQILRAPWQQPLGSERDQQEEDAYHLMLQNSAGDIAAVGRVQQIDATTAQVRYMAVADEWQGQGAGARVLQGLEHYALAQQFSHVVLNARDSAVAFYKKQGYQISGPAPTQFGIVHHRMVKSLQIPGSETEYQNWCAQLQRIWHQTIPLSQFMQLQIKAFDGFGLYCHAPMAPNLNLHQTMFAGSIYTLATLTGWGLLHLQLQSLGLSGALVLADASIQYLLPVTAEPEARCYFADVRGDLTALANGRKVKQRIVVDIYSAGKHCAHFSGLYAALPETQHGA